MTKSSTSTSVRQSSWGRINRLRLSENQQRQIDQDLNHSRPVLYWRDVEFGFRKLAVAEDRDYILGRDLGADQRFSAGHSHVSRRHARLEGGLNGPWQLVDPGSRNGIYADGAKHEHLRLRDDMCVSLGLGERRGELWVRLPGRMGTLLGGPGPTQEDGVEGRVDLEQQLTQAQREKLVALALPLIQGTSPRAASDSEIAKLLQISVKTVPSALTELFQVFGVPGRGGSAMFSHTRRSMPGSRGTHMSSAGPVADRDGRCQRPAIALPELRPRTKV